VTGFHKKKLYQEGENTVKVQNIRANWHGSDHCKH